MDDPFIIHSTTRNRDRRPGPGYAVLVALLVEFAHWRYHRILPPLPRIQVLPQVLVPPTRSTDS
jgi:hypothetical protein